MSVSIVCYDLSSNALGRAVVLAKLVAPMAAVRIVGLRSCASIWTPALDSGVEIRAYPVDGAPTRAARREWLRAQIRGTRLIVSKVQWNSLSLALEAAGDAPPFWLDIDDFELGFVASRARRNPLLFGSPTFLRSALRGLRCERLAHSYAGCHPELVTVSSRWLQNRYGGALLIHARDPRDFARPTDAFVELPRGRRWVGFVGTVRPHKGVEDLVEAIATCSGADGPGLLLAGVDRRDAFVRRLLEWTQGKLGAERLRVLEQFPSAKVPEVLAAADVIVVPSRVAAPSHGQVPAKLFDALFAGKPVVASAVGDIPQILSGCGSVFPPGDVRALAARITELLRAPDVCWRMGEAARQKANAEYSFDAMRILVAERLERLLAVGRPARLC